MKRWYRVLALLAGPILTGGLIITLKPVSAAGGRDFAGAYELSNITDLGDSMSLTFATRVFNYSDADVYGATVALDDSTRANQNYCSFSSVSIPDRGSIRLQCSITIPRREYDSWQNGAKPNLHIDVPNADGTTLRRMVELTQRPVEGAN